MNMEGKRELIVSLHCAGLTNPQIVRKLKDLKVSRQWVKKVIDRYKETQSTKDRPRSGRPVSKRTPKNIKLVRERIRRNPKRSMSRMASDTGMSRRTMGRIVHDDLGMSCYRMRKRHLLSAANKAKRLSRCREILKRLKSDMLPNIIFSDEKLFTVEAAPNTQNDRIISSNISAVPIETKSIFKRQKPASVMVWAGISERGRSPLIFVPEGVKINSQVYLDTILKEGLLPWACDLYKDDP